MSETDAPTPRRLELALAVATALLLAAWCLREDVQPDLYFHLAAGRTMVETTSIPATGGAYLDTPHPEHAFTNHEWLFQVVAWPLFALGGAALLTLVKSTAIVAVFGLLAWRMGRHGSTLRWAILGAATVLAGGRFILRPEVFSLLGVALHLVVLRPSPNQPHGLDRRAIVGLALFQVVWSNVHGFSLLGPLLTGGTLAGALLHRGIVSARPEGPLARRLGPVPPAWIKALAVLLLAEAVASLCNPYGIEAALYPFWVLSRAQQDTASAGLSYRVIELASPFDPNLRARPEIQLFLGWLVVGPVLYLVALLRGRLRLEDGVQAALLVGTALLYMRNLPFAAVGLCLPTAAGLAVVRERLEQRPAWARAQVALTAVAVIATLLLARAVASDVLHRNASYDARPGVGLGQFTTYPESIAFLSEHPPRGKVFNNFGAGHYLIYARPTDATWKPSICGNTDLYPRSYLAAYHEVMRGTRSLITELDRLEVTDVLLDHRVEVEEHVLQTLLDHPAWRLVHATPHALQFRRGDDLPALDRAAFAQAVVLRWRFADEEPDRFPPTRALRAVGLLPRRAVEPIARLQAAQLLMLIGRPDEGLVLAERAAEVAPDSPLVVQTLARLHEARGSKKTAGEYYERLTRLTPGQALPWVKLGLLALQRGDARQAVAHLKTAERLEPTSRLARENLLTALELRRDPVELRRALARFGDAIPPAKHHYFLGASARLEGELDRAEAGFAQALVHDPRLSPAAALLAEVQGQLGKLPEAEASWVRLCKLAPTDASAWRALGSIRKVRGRDELALAAWERAAAVDPRELESLLLAGRLRVRRKERAAAGALLTLAQARAPDDPRVAKLARWVLAMD